jgi:hypothetical protein
VVNVVWMGIRVLEVCLREQTNSTQHHTLLLFFVVEFDPFSSPISWYPIVLVATILSRRYNSRTGSGETLSLPAKPSLTWSTLGQLCITPRTAQSRPVATEPGRKLSLWWHSWRCSTAPLTTAQPGRPTSHLFNDKSKIKLNESKTSQINHQQLSKLFFYHVYISYKRLHQLCESRSIYSP